jgi:hypothetical protein
MEFTQTAAWLRRDYTEQVLDWSRDKARLGIIRYSDKVRLGYRTRGTEALYIPEHRLGREIA